MKLLLDENLSARLQVSLRSVYPEITHVGALGLSSASDEDVWQAAQAGGYRVVTKDSDFVDLQVLRGFPPKILWLRLGNCTTARIDDVLRRHAEDIQAFHASTQAGLLALA